MLGGIDPILIFNLSKNVSFIKTAIEKKIPVASGIIDKVNLPAIPVYLSQEITGLTIDTEDKALEIETSMETSPNSGESTFINQRGLNNTVKIQMIAEKDSIGLTLLSALADFVFPLVTAREISITYLHGPITVFGGLLHSFNINQNANNTLYTISIELIRVGIAQASPIPKIDAIQQTILKNGSKVVSGAA